MLKVFVTMLEHLATLKLTDLDWLTNRLDLPMNIMLLTPICAGYLMIFKLLDFSHILQH
jgi:hypothetical protein